MFSRPSSFRVALSLAIIFSISVVAFGTNWGSDFAVLNFFSPKASAMIVESEPLTPFFTLGTCDGGSNVDVESGGGTALAGYSTVKLAFDAINAGTHTGVINIEVCASTTEGTTPATLNSSGAGSASYTSLNLYPIADAVTVSGNPITGFGVIQLKGSDNVTINGDNPNTAGTNRNLTISNTTTNTVIANSAIRIATAATVVTSADNITIRNSNLLGNVTSGNAAAITSTTGSSNSSFGIYVGGNGGATATDAPTALTSVTTNTAVSGTTVNNLLIDNNSVNQAARAIVFNGGATTVSNGVTISNNLIGDQGAPSPATPPYATPATTVYTKGIWVNGTNSLTVSGNTLNNILSYVGTTMSGIELAGAIGTSVAITNNTVSNLTQNGTTSAVRGILISSATGTYSVRANTITNTQALSASSGTAGIDLGGTPTSGTVEQNRITTVNNRNTGTFGATGLNIAAGTAVTVRNNFISDVTMNMTGGNAFSTTFGVHGLKITGGTGHRVYNNTVNMFGPLVGTATPSILTSAFTIVGTGQTGLDVRNNLFSNTISGGTTSLAHVSMFLPTSATSAMNLTLNNNDYFASVAAGSAGIAHVGTTYTAVPAGPATYAGLYAAADFLPGDTIATTNLRTYTNTLSAALTNDNSSIVTDPVLVSSTDLHLQTGSPARNVGATIASVLNDIDGQLRPGGNALYDMGADEFDGVAPPANDLSATSFIDPANGGVKPAGVNFTPQASFTNNGTSAQTAVTVRYRICQDVGCSVITYNQTAVIASIASGATTTVSFPVANIPVGGAYFIRARSELGTDSVPANDEISGTLTILAPFAGTYTVGTGGNFTSLTNVGGIFDAINGVGATDNITINISSDLTAETGTVALNQIAGGFTVTIKPTGAARTISGTSSTSLVRLNDADSVTIDGSLSGGTAGNTVGGDASLRNLTIQNNSTGTSSAVVVIGSSVNGAQNNTIKNTNIIGNDPLTTIIALSIGGATPGAAGVDNDGNRVENCSIQKAVLGIYNAGASTANPNTTNVITKNDISGTAANRVQRGAILVFNQDGATISLNNIGGINGALGIDHYGIGAGIQDVNTTAVANGGITNTTIARNRINGVSSTSTTGFTAFGIGVAGGTTGPNTIANNMITSVVSPATSPDMVAGIFVASVVSSSTRVYYNSVAMTGNRGVVASQIGSYALAISGVDPTVEVKNNNFYTTQISGGGVNAKSYAIGVNATTFVNLDTNYNDFFSSGANAGFFRSGGLGATATDYATLALWQAAVSDDANSQDVDPLFVDPASNLHLQGMSPVLNDGTSIVGITNDFDGDTRPDGAGVEIGADEQDTTAPNTQILTNPTNPSNSSSATFTFSGTDSVVAAVASFECKLDVGVFAACTSPANYTLLSQGSHTFEVRAVDGAGNVDPTPASYTWTVDAIAPDTTILTGPTNPSNSTSAAFTFSGTDSAIAAVVGFECKLDVGSFAACTSPANYTLLTQGSHTFEVRAVDGAGNVDPTPASFTWTIDTIAPDTTITANPTNPSNSASATFSFTATEVGSTFQCQIDGGGFTTCTSPQNYTGLSNGSHTFQVRATDAAGNTDATPASYTWVIDTVTPETTILTNPTNPTTDTNATFTFSASGVVAGATYTFECKLDAGAFAPCTSPKSYSGLAVGPHNFQVRATDVAGNVDPTPASYSWTINPIAVGPVTVTATTGTTGPTDYPTLKDAFDAVNAGTHTGVVTVSILSNTSETASAVLNASGAGSASYTALTIRPTADGVTISGPTVTGRGLIELNGADNVTIDGDNPGTAGTNRNLTIQNTAANTVTFTSVIRVAIAATVITSADNNTFRNLNLLGSATGRNIAAATVTTASENTTFGIFAGPGASAVTATTAPSAVTSVSTSVGAGATATNLVVSNNTINTTARAVSLNGGAATVFPGLQIVSNLIGTQAAGGADQVYSVGITAQGSADGVIAANVVWVESFLATQIQGINVGVNSAFGTFTIGRNTVNRVRNNNAQTFGAYGINLGGGSNHVVQNNFVSNIINDQTAGTGGFGTTFGAYGIRVASGTGHKVLHNSVNLFGAIGGIISTDITAGLAITTTTVTGMDVRNNIFANRITGGNPTGTRHVAINLPSGATSAFNLNLDNNAYYQGTDPNSRLAQIGSSFSASGVGEYFAANFDPNTTAPASNLRAYTSTLSAAGTNDNASFATTEVPPFVSNADLHINVANPNRLESGGAAVGVTTDIDLETRPNGAAADIGADEFLGVRGPANDIQATSMIDPANGSSRGAGVPFSPQASFTNNGTATQTAVTVRYRIVNSSMVEVYNQTAVIPSIAPGATLIVTFPSTSVMVGTFTVFATAESVGDANPANDTITGTFSAFTPVSGSVNVGTGQTYTSLTNPGGIFAALNAGGASSNVTINITSDLTGETGAVALNPISGSFTVTIKPSGAARTITGTSAASSGLIILNGADNITIDGSLSGGTDRSLTITNDAAAGVVIWIRSASAADGATSNTVKNTLLSGASGTTTIAGVLAGSSTFGSAADAPNSNNTIQNNVITKVQNAAFLSGNAATFDQNWLITGNTFGSTTAADKLGFRGMLLGGAQNFVVSNNVIGGVQSLPASTANMTGIQITAGSNNGLINGNRISDIKQINPTGFGSEGITLSSTSTTSNITVANNFISDIASQGTGGVTVSSNGYGMALTSGGGYKIYFNSVNLQTNQVAATSITAAINVTSAITTAGSVDLRNNIFVNGQTVGTRYAVYSAAAATVYSNINYNDYFAQNVGFIGAAARATLGDWQTATTQDANSLAVDPLFVSATDLHLQSTSPMINVGGTGTGITTDLDGQTRDATPDIGADEFVPVAVPGTLALSSATYSVSETATTVSITVNRTNGTDGIVGATYALTNGTATGGGMCGVGIDYVNTGGTVSFGNGVSTQSFNVTLCPDSLNKVDETFNVTLSAPTGGATLGSPSTAVVTITNDDATPTISINDVTLNEGNAGTTTFGFTVSLSAASGQTVTVQYATADGTATVANSDYTAISATTLTFAPGETTKPVNVLVNGDTTNEANETFFVNLTSPTNSTISDAQGQGNITNDDAQPSISITDVTANEGNAGTTSFGFTVSLSAASGQTVTVQYATADGTATVANSDYTAITLTTLTFAPGETTKPVNVLVTGDTTVEPNENFFVNLTAPTNATILDAQGQGNITNDDSVAGGAFSVNDVRVTEGNAGTVNATFTVTYTAGGAANVTFATANRTATAGTDYVANTNTLTFPASASTQTQTVNVVVNGDVVKEANETFAFNLSAATGGATITDNQGIGIIVDEDRLYVSDFDDDAISDFSVYRPSEGRFYTRRSTNATAIVTNFGLATDRPVPGDYDNDGKNDVAVYRPSNSTFYILNSSTSTVAGFTVGVAGDKPVQGDYNGDGRTEVATFRPSNGLWSVYFIESGTSTAQLFGISTDRPVQGDYDGDAKTDLAVYRDGVWYVLLSSNASVVTTNWGNATDKPVSGDFDGDGKFDYAIYRNGQWWVINSLAGNSTVVAWGISTDIPSPADFDGDGTTDVTVFRPSSGDWYVLRSSNNTITGVNWGVSGDIPMPSATLPQ